MESDQFLGYSSLASAQRTVNSAAYHPAFILDATPHLMNPNESFQISRNFSHPVADLRPHDFNLYGRRNSGQQSTLELLLPNSANKSEFSESSFSPSSGVHELNPSSSKYLQKLCEDDAGYQNPWFNFSTSPQLSAKDQLPSSTAQYTDPYRFSEINTSLYSTSEMGLNLDHLSPGIYQPLREKVDIRDESMPWSSHCLMQQYSPCLVSPSNSSNKVSTVPRTKKVVAACSSVSSSKESYSSDVRKTISRSKPARPPLKVRKEKLGDRVSALQRLVAPFGKTDTASVLSEVIGYIQFLHDQVQTLSVPYMKSTPAIARTCAGKKKVVREESVSKYRSSDTSPKTLTRALILNRAQSQRKGNKERKSWGREGCVLFLFLVLLLLTKSRRVFSSLSFLLMSVCFLPFQS